MSRDDFSNKTTSQPDLKSEPDFSELTLEPSEKWIEAQPFPRSTAMFSYVSGDPRSRRIRVRYFRHEDGTFAGRIWMGPECEGPPGHAHGGSQAALLDEGMGAVAWLSGHTVLAAKIEINFRAPLPLGTVLTMTAKVEKVDGRKIHTRGELRSDDGEVYSEGSGLFIVIDPSKFKPRSNQP